MVIGKEYYCPSCNKSFSCVEQEKVIEAQKYFKRYKVSEEEIAEVYNNQLWNSVKSLLKSRWLLMLPIIGSLICMFRIFNSKLSELTKTKDGSIVLLASVLAFIGVALAAKIMFLFIGNDFSNSYKNILMLILSSFSFNIPVLWYINHRFKKY